MLDTGCSILDARYWILDGRCSMLDARYWMLDTGCSILDARCSILDTGWSMLDARCSMLDTGCSILDTRCSILDAGCSMLDTGRKHGIRRSAHGIGSKMRPVEIRIPQSTKRNPLSHFISPELVEGRIATSGFIPINPQSEFRNREFPTLSRLSLSKAPFRLLTSKFPLPTSLVGKVPPARRWWI